MVTMFVDGLAIPQLGSDCVIVIVEEDVDEAKALVVHACCGNLIGGRRLSFGSSLQG